MENEFWHKILKVIVILALSALAVYILIATLPVMLSELGHGHRSSLFTDFIFLVLILPIVVIIIGIIRSWK